MTTPAFIIVLLTTDQRKELAKISASVKQFKTGSRGFYANQKVEIDEKRYQAQIQLIEIGSKKSAAARTEAEKG